MKPVTFIMRVLQISFIVSVVLFFRVSAMIPPVQHSVSASFQYGIVLCAIASALIGFIVQRMFLRVPNQTTLSTQKSTPLNRWFAGHLIRFATAESVALFGLVLRMIGSSSTLVYLLFGGGLALLLIWQPGAIPVQTESQSSAG
jgi:hypothetical protein